MHDYEIFEFNNKSLVFDPEGVTQVSPGFYPWVIGSANLLALKGQHKGVVKLLQETYINIS